MARQLNSLTRITRLSSIAEGAVILSCALGLFACSGGSGGSFSPPEDGVLFAHQPSPLGVSIAGNDLYWSNCGTACVSAPPGVGVWRARQDGSSAVALWSDAPVRNVFAVGEKLYFSRDDDLLYVMDRNGDGRDAAKVASHVFAVGQAGDKLYALESDSVLDCVTTRLLVFDGHGERETVADDAPCGGTLAASGDLIFVGESTSLYPNARSKFSTFSLMTKKWKDVGEIDGEIRQAVALHDVLYVIRTNDGHGLLEGISAEGEHIEVEGLNEEPEAFAVSGGRLLVMEGDKYGLYPRSLLQLSGTKLSLLTTLSDRVRSIWSMVASPDAVFWTGSDVQTDGVVGATPLQP